jgi:hypothetical protein
MPSTRSGASGKAAAATPSRASNRRGKARVMPSSSFDDDGESLLTSLLPTECLIEILRCLEVHELLDAAWTCKRIQQAAQDRALWGRTHFSVADWKSVLKRHFAEDPSKRTEDHTGVWTRCVCRLTQVRARASVEHAEFAPLRHDPAPAASPGGCVGSKEGGGGVPAWQPRVREATT